MLDVFLTRIVVSRGGEGKGVFTTGPLVPLEPGDEPAKARVWFTPLLLFLSLVAYLRGTKSRAIPFEGHTRL